MILEDSTASNIRKCQCCGRTTLSVYAWPVCAISLAHFEDVHKWARGRLPPPHPPHSHPITLQRNISGTISGDFQKIVLEGPKLSLLTPPLWLCGPVCRKHLFVSLAFDTIFEWLYSWRTSILDVCVRWKRCQKIDIYRILSHLMHMLCDNVCTFIMLSNCLTMRQEFCCSLGTKFRTKLGHFQELYFFVESLAPSSAFWAFWS